jgi:hypothetical protein
MKRDKKDYDPGRSFSCGHADNAVLYVTGELPDVDRAEFEGHMRECVSCRTEVENLAAIAGRLRPLAEPDAPVVRDVTAAVLARIPERAWGEAAQASSNPTIITWPLLLRAAAGLLILIGCSVLLMNHLSTDPGPVGGEDAQQACLKPEAIESGLAWLVSVQEPSGAWDPAVWGGKKEFRVALTSLALLGLVEQEQAATDPERARAVEKGAAFICGEQTEDGSFGSESEGRMYNHGIASVALLKAYAVTHNESLKDPISKGLSFINKQQLANGGWGYGSHPTEQANTSISVWQLHALITARDKGFPVNGSITRGLNWLVGVIDPKGYFGYHAPLDSAEDADTLTAMGAYCLFASGQDVAGTEPLRMRIRGALKEAALRAEKDVDFYRWYFLAHALNAEKEADFEPILMRLQESLVQHFDGNALPGS